MPKAALELGHVTVRLGGRNVVDGVSFSVEHGDWVTLIGPNGAGKTSLMRAIAGLVGHRGEIRLDGDPPENVVGWPGPAAGEHTEYVLNVLLGEGRAGPPRN